MTHNCQIAVRNLLWEGEFYCANAEYFAAVRRKKQRIPAEEPHPTEVESKFPLMADK